MASSSVSVYFSEDLLKWLDEEAEKNKRSRSELIRLLLEEIRAGRLTRKEEEIEETPPTLRKTIIGTRGVAIK